MKEAAHWRVCSLEAEKMKMEDVLARSAAL